jgi:hypothetical protein
MAVAFSPIDNMENFTTSFYYASHKLKAYLSDPTSNASVMAQYKFLCEIQNPAWSDPRQQSPLTRPAAAIRH